MLSIKMIKNVKDAKHYFVEQDNYYLKDSEEIKEASKWFGRGAAKLGLNGSIDANLFEQLLEGKLLNGVQVGKKLEDGSFEHRPGWDLTFSAPKSVSILAEVGQDKRLQAAHDQAVSVALSYVERACSQARKSISGNMVFENTNNFIAATFRHDTSRALDPHLHTHSVIMNLTERSDGQWRSMASHKSGLEGKNGFLEQVYDNKLYFGAIYRAELAYRVKQAGYDIQKTHDDGRFEIVGVPKELIEHYSTRRKDIESFLENKGWDGAKAAAFAALETRDKKQAINRDELRLEWLKGSKEFNFDVHAFINESIEKTKNPITDKILNSSTESEAALSRVVEHLSENDVRLSHHKILNGMISEGLGSFDSREAISVIEKSVEQGGLIPLPHAKGELFYTTQAMVQAEEKLTQTVLNNQCKAFSLMSHLKAVETVNGRTDLSGEQKDSIAHLLTSCDRFIAMDGISGSGKMKVVLNIAQILQREKISTIYLTTTKAEVESLQDKNIKTGTISAFITEINSNVYRLKKPQLIVLDNAQQYSVKQLQTVFGYAERIRSKVLLSGDTKGYLNYSAGSPFEQLIKGGMQTTVLKEIQRKLPEASKHAIKDTIQGDLNSAMAKMGNRFVELDNEEDRLKRIAVHYADLNPNEKKNTLVLTANKQTSYSVNALIREELKQKNELSNKEISFSVLIPKYLSGTQKKYAKYYEIDSYVRFNKDNAKSKLYRGNYYQVVSRDIKNNIVTVKNKKGQAIEWDIAKSKVNLNSVESFTLDERKVAVGEKINLLRGIASKGLHASENLTITDIKKEKLIAERKYGQKIVLDMTNKSFWHIDYSYASTPHRVQHQTPKNIIAHHPSQSFQITQRDFYKVLAKASDNVWLYTDNKENYLYAMKDKTGNKLSAIDSLTSPSQDVHTLKEDIQTIIKSLKIEYQNKNSKYLEVVSLNAARYAMQHLTERDAGFTHKELLETAIKYALGNTYPEQLEKATLALEQAGDLIKGIYRTDGTRWTTHDAIQCEEQLLKIVNEGIKSQSPIATIAEVDKHVENSILGADQKQAAREILSTENQFVILQAPPGSGKTTLMHAIRSIAESKGFTVKGIAPTHGAVSELAKEGIESQTLQKFLIDAKRLTDFGKTSSLKSHLFILDETSLVSNQDCLEFAKFITTTGARAIQSGDNRQHLSPEAGNPFDLQQRAGIQTIKLTEIRRQEKDRIELRQAVKLAMDKDYRGAIEAVDTQTESQGFTLYPQNKKGKDLKVEPPRVIQIEDKTERLLAIAEDYLAREPERRENTILIAPRNEDRVMLNLLVREGLKEQGQLKSNAETLDIFVPKHLTLSQLNHHANYEVGDVIRFNRNVPALSINKGSYVTVYDVNKTDNHIVLRDKEKEIHWQLNHLTMNQRGVMEVYKREVREICKGDRIRWTRSDKSQGFLGGDKSIVIAITQNNIILCNDQNQIVQLEKDNPKHSHWDHAYAFTSYAVQGAGKPEVISHEDSKYKHLSSQRAFLVNLTRSKQQFTLYTDNKEQLIKRIIKTTGDKHIALEVVGKLKSIQSSIKPISQRFTKSEKTQPIKTWDAHDISHRLADSAEYIVEKLLGEPKKKSGREWRYGSNQGSLIITMQGDKRGFWYDHQTGEGGHLMSLIAKQYGHTAKEDFRKTLDVAADLLGLSDSQKINVAQITKHMPHLDKSNLADHLTDKQKKSIEKAKVLFAESQAIQGTLAERYLREHRNITKPLPDSLRYHPSVKSRINGKTLPALLMICRDEKNEVKGVQAIFLDPETRNKSRVEVVKQSFGLIGGHPVTIQEGKSADSATLICEGAETALSLREADADKTIKATLSLSNYLNLPKNLPSNKIIFCLDNDGENQSENIVMKKAYDRLQEAGKEIYTNQPNLINQLKKTDYNDVLKHQGKHAIADYIHHSKPYQEKSIAELSAESRNDTKLHIKTTVRSIQLGDIHSRINKDVTVVVHQRSVMKNIEKGLDKEL